MKYIFIIFCCLFLCLASSAQCNKADSVTYQTTDIGNGIQQIDFPLTFLITKDSVFIMDAKSRTSSYFLSLKILENSCHFDEASKTTARLLKVQGNSKKGILNVTERNKKGKIQLLYENSEPRFFTLKDQ